MKKILIVSPNWPPVAYPDMQRARMACAHLREFGWEPLVLSVDPAEQVGAKDPLLLKTLPADLKSWQAGAIPKSLTRLLGVRSVGYRSFLHMAFLGSRIIERERVDLVFFSTTMFMLFLLGPYWRWKHRVPFVTPYARRKIGSVSWRRWLMSSHSPECRGERCQVVPVDQRIDALDTNLTVPRMPAETSYFSSLQRRLTLFQWGRAKAAVREWLWWP